MSLERRIQVVGDTPGADQGDGFMAAVKVAFATSDMKSVNQHFGAAQSFVIYGVNPEQARIIEAVEFGSLSQDGNEDKLVAKISALRDCAAVYCHAIGASAVRQLMSQGVQPVKVSDNAAIADLLAMLQQEMSAGPSAWLAKAIEKNKGPDPGRFDHMEAEGWDE